MSIGNSKIRVACVGTGYFSQFHYDAWARIEAVDVVACVNRSIDSATATGLAAFDDLAEMLQSVEPDLLDIITPPQTHLDYIQLAVDGGVKIIICQKPFCSNLDEARKAVSLCKAAGIPIIVHENFRFQPWYRAMKKALDEGIIGEAQQLAFRLRTGDGQGPDAYLERQPYFQEMPRFLIHETGVHWVDTFRYLFGEPVSVYADLRKLNPVIAGEDAGYVLFEFAGGKRALFDGNRHLDHAAENCRTTLGECLLEGTKGTITLDGLGNVRLRSFNSKQHISLLKARNWPGFAGDCVHALQSHVVSGFLGDMTFENQAEDYLRVLELEAAIYDSAQTGCKVKV